MKKAFLIILSSILIISMVTVCGVTGLSAWIGVSLWNEIGNWKQEDEKWNEVLVPVNQFEGQVIFLAQAAHPLLAEYNYKIKISKENQEEEFFLPMNTGGSINENFYLIKFEGKNFLEARQTLIDLDTTELVKDPLKENSFGKIDDTHYYNILIKGERSYLGRVFQDKGLVFSPDKVSSKNIDAKNINWNNWKELPSKKGQIRFGVDQSTESTDQGYLEISTGSRSEVFEINLFFGNSTFTIEEYNYDDFSYVFISGENTYTVTVFNVDSLINIRNSGITTYAKNNKNIIEFNSQFLSNVAINGNSKKVGAVKFEGKKAVFTN